MRTPMPAAADQAPNAFGRSWAGKIRVMIARVAGMTNAAPRPITARQAMSWPGESDRAAIAEPPPKTTRPPSRAVREPSRAPRMPARIKAEAKTRVYASVIHCRSLVPACRAWASDGSAVLSTELSRVTATSVRLSTARAAQRRGYSDMTEAPYGRLLTPVRLDPSANACKVNPLCLGRHPVQDVPARLDADAGAGRHGHVARVEHERLGDVLGVVPVRRRR